ncbi:MAG: hypothetical protein U1A27_02755 [Phycisphaerae bacterium]
MNKLRAIAVNTFHQTVRQPIYAVIILTMLGAFVMAPPLTGWTLDDDNKLLRDIGLSTLLMQGLFLAAFSASAVLSQEIDQKTVLTTVSKPLPRGLFILGKALGVFAAAAVAHLIATIALLMTVRHGVLQTASDSSDPTVLVLGPGVVLLMLVAAAVLNYLFDWKYLPTAVGLIAPALVISMTILFFIDRDWTVSRYRTVQENVRLPAEILPLDKLAGIVEFESYDQQPPRPGVDGRLVRHNWKGPITDEERTQLRDLSPDESWHQRIDWLVVESRKITTPDLLKASFLVFLAVLILCAVALAASTRLAIVPTLLLCVVALCAGLVTDHFLQPLDVAGALWAKVAYRVLPNFQLLWMIDALSDDRVIPWSYVAGVAGYTAAQLAALVALAAALFETREVG